MSASTSEVAEKPITYEDLPTEHKKKYDDLKVILEAELIGFEKTRSHGVRFKGFAPQGILDGLDLSLPSEERTKALRPEINYMVAHSPASALESLVNTLERVAGWALSTTAGPKLRSYLGAIAALVIVIIIAVVGTTPTRLVVCCSGRQRDLVVLILLVASSSSPSVAEVPGQGQWRLAGGSSGAVVFLLLSLLRR
ncbi:hypothetical protein QYE76_036991 [Lolium multiflorum]|uniref:Uncharacterized protein n=1 Tax=Lolium multiflorum TaxID=4521 RepID=A0AAD8R5Y7_LOLMU|nr:hypothetical protein QYE76_036991 [Lolium multiflorum]